MSRINQVIIIGHNPIAKVLYEKCKRSGVSVFWNDLSQGINADVIIETENSNREEKKKAIQEIEAAVHPETTILSTVLRLPTTEIASWAQNPSRIVGFGTFATIERTGLVEIAPALQTNPSHLNESKGFFRMIGNVTEVVKDEVGLVFPRILAMIINEAAFALMENTADAASIDEAMKKGTNYPYGPLEWAEKIGLEDIYAILQGLFDQLGEERYRPASLIKKLIYAGWTGEKAQKGFYYYQNHLRGSEVSE
ncbi:3-hydroxyacyl-CoA dehydrogenase family protein [Aquibacillus sp. 3ASR75-11]|uniref:3-hydroxyacyl-CoA dehydrogenase family protein n=1 Tax=Terrihalobacillus insolitus TaxID=2950438 RepID=A0A9X3WU95_9BACI|nr:3-hydroxyacyl-CoA dehydrogenase family protein [Terrihalobacillus insolitus]MDC3415162.1 3-hydroxyacyl-CoA dehydrogenase family protein [Terrihalobacillus insolitus]MDC3424066.1 3-hydroxyacyl-CoA dehydrogenase family protein [Terrihalobacillus insolitus]